jgi:hypothetical protein
MSKYYSATSNSNVHVDGTGEGGYNLLMFLVSSPSSTVLRQSSGTLTAEGDDR